MADGFSRLYLTIRASALATCLSIACDTASPSAKTPVGRRPLMSIDHDETVLIELDTGGGKIEGVAVRHPTCGHQKQIRLDHCRIATGSDSHCNLAVTT